uniref:Uncharacterized protein n=1 Tax=Chromera velia CCMP2878 TaxID=1169474 RepID=A0A0G4F5D6_9ALVE|eukprot:Cvel_15270.t1-p1 / transcript=Cvel_15270.t1 / gene=Cvel_15270 / organism=Chromera_velia_CCMP2878 / gene_product=hypothetical protein / transcript_product=hypothetical protein / location=Cvel_scaffold1119:51680-55416(+) / protein_length=101 / sequence_SO=supercontig / SO=protein_coding / is_pseudo=false
MGGLVDGKTDAQEGGRNVGFRPFSIVVKSATWMSGFPVLETQESDRSTAAEPSADAAPEVQESPNVDPPTESLRSRSDVPVVSVTVAAAAVPAAVPSSKRS